MENKIYDLAIIGAGPAGYTASIYASRYEVNNVIIGEMPGGLASEAHLVCNFPSEKEIGGMELALKMQEHALTLGAHEITDRVIQIEEITTNDNPYFPTFRISMNNQEPILARTILIAIGLQRRHLNVEGEAGLLGKGVSYCATCDGAFYKGRKVAVVGGGNAAVTASLYLADIADRVYQIYRGNKLKGEVTWINQLQNNSKIEVIYEANVIKMIGEQNLQALVLDREYQGSVNLAVEGVFVEIGSIPDRTLIDQLGLKTTLAGYLEVDGAKNTNRKGVFAAGDITNSSNHFKQIITACSDGAIAADTIYRYLSGLT
jgi:thioredoxin reductase (NADPH)